MTMTFLEAVAVVRAARDRDAEIDFTPAVEVIEPAQPVPELPAECWNGTKPDGTRCMAATRSLCGG